MMEACWLKARGFDVEEVREAIRELASCYYKTEGKYFGFSKDRSELIKLLRQLKWGSIQSDYFYFNKKAFHIKCKPPSYDEATASDSGAAQPDNKTIDRPIPSAPPKPSSPEPSAPPAYFSLFSPAPPTYDETMGETSDYKAAPLPAYS